MIRYFAEQDEMLVDLRAEPERFWETGDRVLVFLQVAGRGRTSETPFRHSHRHLLTLEGGLVVRGQGFGNRGEALEAAGLSDR